MILPGFPVLFPVAVPTATIAYFASSGNTGNTPTITCPASIAAGDLIILLDNSFNPAGSIPTAVTPSGWTQAVSQGDNFPGTGAVRTSICYKTADGSEGGTSITGMSSSTPLTEKLMLVFRPTGGTPTWTPSGAAADNDASASPTIGTITAGSAPGVMVCYGNNFGVGSDNLTMSPAGSYGNNGSARAGYIVYNSSPANNTPTVADLGSISGVWFTLT